MELEATPTGVELTVAQPDTWPPTGVSLELATKQGLRLRWAPLLTNRSHVTVRVMSPCCGVKLEAPLKPESQRHTCSRCYKPLTIPTVFITLSNLGASWRLDAPDVLASVCDKYTDPLTAAFIAAQVSDLLIETMNRASAEYAWAPEGNLRGSDPLTVEKQLSILDNLVYKFNRDRGEHE